MKPLRTKVFAWYSLKYDVKTWYHEGIKEKE